MWSNEKMKIQRDLKNSLDTAHDEGFEEGKLEGKEEGRLEGKEEGMMEERQNIILKLRNSGFDKNKIAEITKFDIDFVIDVLDKAD